MSNGGNDNDWLRSFFPDWQGEEQAPENPKDNGSDQVQQQKPHPAFADAAQMAQAAHAAYVGYQQSRSLQAHAVQMKQQEQNSALHSQGMDQTPFRSRLHRHSPYEQPEQQAQIQSQQHTQPYESQPRAQQQHRTNVQYQAQEQARQLPRPQYQAQHQPSRPPSQRPPQQPTQQPFPTQHGQLQKYYREAENQRQARAQSTPSPQEDRAQPPLQQYQYRDVSNEQQYVRMSDINPNVSYYQSSSTSRQYAPPVSVPSPLPAWRSTPSPTLAQPPHPTSQCPVEANSRPPTGAPSQKTYASPASQHASQQSPSLASSQPPQPAPSAQRNSTPVITQQVSDARPKTPPRAPSYALASSKQQEPPRRGSFIEDTTIGSTSPQKDPYTSASRSTLGPRATSTSSASMAANPAPAPASARPKRSPAVSHAHPSPKPRDSAAKPAPMSVSAATSPSVPAPAQRPTPGSPMMNANSAGPATDTGRPSIAASTTSSSSRGPAVPSVLNAIPPALQAYVTPQMLKTYTPPQKLRHTAPSQSSAQTSLSTSTSSASPVISKPTVPAASQTPKPTVPPQTSAPTARGTFASRPSVNSKPTVSAVQQLPRTINSPQHSASISRSISASSASSVNSTTTMHAGPQMTKATISSQAGAQTARSTSSSLGPPDNFTPFVSTSTPPTTTSGVNPRPAAAPPTSIPTLPPQARLAEPPRKRGRPCLHPEVVNPVDQAAGPQAADNRWQVYSHSNPTPNERPDRHQPVLSGLPVYSNTAAAPAPPSSWKLHPAPVNRFQPSSSQFAADSRTLSQGMPPRAGHQPARVYEPQPRQAPNVGRLTTAVAFGPVQPRYPHTQPLPVSTQLPAAKMRKLVDGSRHAVTAPSKTLDLAQYVRQSLSRKHITYRGDIVDTINASNAAIKVNYHPATIARDILIVADRHPTEKSLNHHLHVLRQNFVAVNYESDLATFRWDIVDPYVHYPPGVEEAFSWMEGSQKSTISTTRPDSIAQPPNLSTLPNLTAQAGPAGPSRNDEPHVAARDFSPDPLARPVESRTVYNTVPGTTGIGPTSIGTTGTTSARTTTYVTAGAGSQSLRLGSTAGTEFNTTRFGTIGHLPTGADTAQTGATNNHHVRSSYLAQPTTPAIARTPTPDPTAHKPIPTPPSAVKLNAFGALPFKPSPYYSPLHPTGQPLPYYLPPLPPPASSQEIHPPVSAESPALSQPPPTGSVFIPTSLVKVKSVLSASPSKPAETGPLPQLSQAASDSPRGKPSRKSSLPKGLPEPQVVIPCSSEAMTLIKRKPGRPPKTAVQVKVAIDNRPAPQYQVFPCKWTKCDAELHSLQAIQSHIVGVHIPHHITCAWEGCTDQTPRAAAAMWDHVKDDHMRALAWQLGDGPAGSVTVADGNESAQALTQGRHDIMTLPADRDLVKIFSRTHGTQTPKQKAQLMYEGGRRWKEGAGPELDASDRSLSTPTRLLSSSHTETAYTVSEVRVVI